MTNEERDIITRFIERVGGARPTGLGSVPGTAPPLPPIDRDADALIGDLFARNPEARYRLTQTAFVQESALVEAQNRIRRLEWEVGQARQMLQQAQAEAQAAQSRGGGGFLSGLFGGGQPRPQQQPQGPWGGAPGMGQQGYPQQAGGQPQWGQSAPPPPQYPPNYQPGMFQRGGGSGFLGSALTTAAGVAGGMVVGNALMNMFSSHGAAASELLPTSPADSPWGSPGGGALPEPPVPPTDSYVDQGAWSTPDTNTAQNDQGFTDPGGWDVGQADPGQFDPSQSDQASWTDTGSWSDDDQV